MLSGTIVPQFIELLPQIKIENCDQKTAFEFANCIEICLKTFKGPCSSRKKLIEDFIFKLSSSPNFNLFAKSFALLAFTGSNKQLQTNNSFNHFMIICVYSLDTLIDSNFNETHQLSYYSSIKESPFLALNSNLSRIERTLDFLNKFKFLSLVIQHLLGENFDGQVKIPMNLILNLAQRIALLKLNKNNTTANLESILNSNIIPAMYRNALMILDQLINTCSTNLSTNLKEINKILVDLLGNFNVDQQQENEKNYLIEIKSTWYKVISNWFNKLGNHLTILVSKQWEDLLIDSFLQDIQLKKDRLELQNKKQLQNERSTNTKFTDSSHFSNKELVLCSMACETMNSLLINFSRQMNAKKLHKFINQLLILIQDLYRIELWRKSTYFIDSKVRLSLLKVFRSCLISFLNTSLLNNGITILNTILKLDKSSDIQLFAKETLIIINSPKNKIYYSMQDMSSLALSSSSNTIANNNNDQTNDGQLVSSDSPDSISNTQQDESPVLEDNETSNKDEDNLNKLLDENRSEFEKQIKESFKITKISDHENLNQWIQSEVNSVKNLTAMTSTVFTLLDKSEIFSNDKTTNLNEVLANKEIVNVKSIENEKELDNYDDKISNDNNSNDTSPAKKATRSKLINKPTNELPAKNTRMTRSAVKKRLEENEQSNDQNCFKKLKTQDEKIENAIQKQSIDEDCEVNEILKDFVDT